jgi:signal transduction histidine kinase
LIDLGDGRGLGVFPMIVHGRPVGVLQVDCPRGGLDRNRMVLEILAEHLAMQTAIEGAQRDELAMGVAWTAHEIRGPLLGLRSALETLLGRAGERRDQSLLRASLSELERLVTSSRVLLDLAVGQSTMDVRPADVVRIVEEATTAVRLEEGDERAVPIFLHTAIVNLLRNALAYSDPGTKVEVSVERHADRVDVSVTNEGVGIPPEERQSIFDPFVRGNSAHRTPEGRGLGLFIAWRAIEAQGGRIRVEPESHGVTFRVTLPARGGGPRRSGS